ncbi:hypothetical protein AAHC03_05622 [Spirometra sp. Aus1]
MESPNTRNGRPFTRFVSAPDFVVRPRVCRLNSAPDHGFPEQINPNSPSAFSSRQSSDQTVTPLDSPPAREPAPDVVFPSTTFLHIHDRPSVLPKKDPSEAERHRRECERIIMQIKKKQEKEYLKQIEKQDSKLAIEARTQNMLKFWRSIVLPNWNLAYRSKRVYQAWWYGLPSAVRSQVWSLVIGNPLGITRELFEACLKRSQEDIQRLDRERLEVSSPADLSEPGFFSHCDNNHPVLPLPTGPLSSANANDCSPSRNPFQPLAVAVNGDHPSQVPLPRSPPFSPILAFSTLCPSAAPCQDTSLQIIRLDISRTFPQLGLFQADGPYHRDLHDLLAAYVSFQPSVGYLQGMSFIAAILLLVMGDILAAFIAFASILNRDSFHAFYSLDECEFTAYFSAFDRLLETCLPRLHAHLLACRLDSRLYLFDWLFTIFSRSLPLEANLRVWDLFFRDGESALILAALGIMRMYEEKLLASDFDQLASFLTGPMPADMCPEELASSMRSFGLRKRTIRSVIAESRREARAAEPNKRPVSSSGEKQTSKSSNPSARSSVLHTQPPSTVDQNGILPAEKDGGHSTTNGPSPSASTVSLEMDLEDEIWDLSLNDPRPANGFRRVATIASELSTANNVDGSAKGSPPEPLDRTRRSSEAPEPSSVSNGKTPFFTRLMLLPRQSSMEEWSSLVRCGFPRADIDLPDGMCSKFLFTH